MSKRSIDAVDGPAVRDEAEIKRARRDTFLHLAGPSAQPGYMPDTPTIITPPSVSVSLSDQQYSLQRLMQDLDPRLPDLNKGEIMRINRIRVDLITTWGAEMNPLLVQAWETYLDAVPKFAPHVRADALDQPVVRRYLKTFDLSPCVGMPVTSSDPVTPANFANKQYAPLVHKELTGYTTKQYMLQEAMEELDGIAFIRDDTSSTEVHAAIDALRRELVEALGADMHPALVEQWKKYLHM